SALCTEYLGLHLLFGAFLMGAILPKERKFVQYILDRFETVTVVLLLPLFFAYTGLRTSIGLVHGPDVDVLRADHAGRDRRENGWNHDFLTPGRAGVARIRGIGCPDEHSRPHGTGHSERRAGHQGDFSCLIFHDGRYGAGHDVHDRAAAGTHLSRAYAYRE